jgi:surface polysaccharide O-acyltransferase-like enzyme
VSDTDLEFGAGGWPFLYYIFFLLYGFVIVSHERLQAKIKGMRWLSLVAGLILGAAYVFLNANAANPAIKPWENAIGDLLWILSACTLLPAFLGLAMQHLTHNAPFLKYASEAVMGFYILHQTILLVVGYFVLPWAIPDPVKWVVIFASSFIVIMAIYEYLVRRNNLLRFLFGMRSVQRVAAFPSKQVILAGK